MKSKTNLFIVLSITSIILVFAFIVRAVGLVHTPPSLYWEEVALGYDAYSILKTGKDHHGNAWPIVAFESFGDWKPSLYFYTLVPFIAAFGLEPWVVRIPSVIAGFFTVMAIGLLSFKVAKQIKLGNPRLFGLIGLFLAAISSWAIHFSRGGWEVNLATALVTWSVVFGLFAIKKQQKKIRLQFPFVLGSSVLLVLAMYAYHGTRMVSPLLGIGLFFYWTQFFSGSFKTKLHNCMPAVLSGVLTVVLLLPILLSLQSPQVTQRFAETSVFSQLSIIEKSNAYKELAGNSFLSRILYHRYLLFGQEIAINYFDHFNFDFLFISGDLNPRHSTGYGGHLYYQDFLFLLLGIGVLLTKKKKEGWLLIFWWLIGILPAALTKTTPHALRILPVMPAVITIIALGLGQTILTLEKWASTHFSKKLPFFGVLIVIFSGLYVGTFSIWWRHYWTIYPQRQAHEWQYGYQQMIAALQQAKQTNDLPTYITDEQGRPAMYYWFFTKTDPQEVQAEEEIAKKDQSEFITFKQIAFPNSVNEISVNNEGALVASSNEGLEIFKQRGQTVEEIATITHPLGEITWQVYVVK
jgi:hypothetical protein